MSFHLFQQRLKYHYKKYLAIFFDSLAIAFISADFIISLLQMTGSFSSTILSGFSYIWNFAILMVCYIYILKGNMQGTSQAFQGVLSFVFLVLFLLIVNTAVNSVSNLLLFASGSWQSSLISSLYLLFSLLQIVSGIFSYIRLRQYMLGRYSNTKSIALWYSIFMGSLILTYGFQITLYVMAGGASILLLLLQPLSELSCAIACLFTVLRTND